MSEYTFAFKGGVANPRPDTTIKFLLFLVNGGKEISFFEAKKVRLLVDAGIDFNRPLSSYEYTTNCGLVKVFLYERITGQKPLLQSFYLALGVKGPRKEVTIRPLNIVAKGCGYFFTADARFLKQSEASAILDENSLSAKMLYTQERLPVETLRKFITIKRFEAPKVNEYVAHGGVRRLRI
jgi:hypothetical protein